MATPAIVAPPDRPPGRGGLFSVLTFRGDEDRWLGGITFPGQSCTAAEVKTADLEDCVPHAVTTSGTGMEWRSESDLITVNKMFECSPVGVTLDEAEDRAVADLVLHEETAVEQFLWLDHLRNAPVAQGVTGPVSVDEGLGWLEQFADYVYGTPGIVHAPRRLIPSMDVERQGERVVTKRLGTPVVAGGGYAFAIPDDYYKLVLSPPIVAYRSQVEILGAPEDMFDRDENLVQILAQRTYRLAFDSCPLASVEIDLTL